MTDALKVGDKVQWQSSREACLKMRFILPTHTGGS
jgi:hypothetical protein